MKLIEDGNLSFPIRTLLIIIGAGIGAVSFVWFRSILLMSIGLGVAAIGGYASKAHQLGIKPFDNSYKKARKSHEVAGDKQDDPK